MQNYKISPRGNFSPVKVSKLRKVTTIYYFGHAYETNKQYKFRNPDRYTPRIILTVPWMKLNTIYLLMPARIHELDE